MINSICDCVSSSYGEVFVKAMKWNPFQCREILYSEIIKVAKNKTKQKMKQICEKINEKYESEKSIKARSHFEYQAQQSRKAHCKK